MKWTTYSMKSNQLKYLKTIYRFSWDDTDKFFNFLKQKAKAQNTKDSDSMDDEEDKKLDKVKPFFTH